MENNDTPMQDLASRSMVITELEHLKGHGVPSIPCKPHKPPMLHNNFACGITPVPVVYQFPELDVTHRDVWCLPSEKFIR